MSTSEDVETEDYTLSYVHGTVMVIAWMIFASTGILFARYGRSLHIGGRVKVLGELIWFQIHRFTGLLAFTLSIPTIFLITFVLPNYRHGLIPLDCCCPCCYGRSG